MNVVPPAAAQPAAAAAAAAAAPAAPAAPAAAAAAPIPGAVFQPNLAQLPARLDPNRGGNILEAGHNAFEATQGSLNLIRGALMQIANGAFDVNALNAVIGGLDQTQQQLAQSQHLANVGRHRAGGYEVIPIVTELPDFDGKVLQGIALDDNVPNLRELHKVTLSGTESRGSDGELVVKCRAFLDRVMQTSESRNLTVRATRQLLYEMSSGEVQLITGEMLREDRSLEDIVRKIEVTYGGLKSPEDARRTLDRIRREAGETIMALGRRISQEARMATRMDPYRHESFRSMAVEALLRKVPEIEPCIRRLDDDQMKNGRPRLSYDDVLLEATREEGRMKSHSNQMSRYRSTIRQVGEAQEYYNSADEDSEEEDGPEVQYIHRVMEKFMKDRGKMRDRYPPKPGFLKDRAPRNGQEANPKKPQYAKQDLRRKPPGVRQVQELPDPEEEMEWDEATEEDMVGMAIEGINYVQGVYFIPQGDAKRPFARVTPAQLNIHDPNQCLKCGLQGHRAFGQGSDKCPLQGEPLMPNPCYNCGTGGHSSLKCPLPKKNPKN